MSAKGPITTTSRRLFMAAAALQIACGMGFLIDALSEWGDERVHAISELLAVAALWTGAAVTLWGLYRLMDRNAAVEEQLEAASGAFHTILLQKFDAWGLTPSERDVALLAIKGLSITEIAAVRETREGTIRAQHAAIYRKAGVSGRADLLALFIEEIAAGLPDPNGRAASEAA